MALAAQEEIQKRGASGQKASAPNTPERRAAKVRLADLEDAVRIAQFLSTTWDAEIGAAEVSRDLEQGGALLLEEASGTLLCALVWREAEHGWTLQQPAVSATYRDQELDRWVLTRLEALAIQRNIPALEMQLRGEAHRPYYTRMGYRAKGEGVLSKRVGGTWQTQGR